MASLIIGSGPRLGQSFWLGERINIVGKAPWSSLRLTDGCASAEHVKIYYDPDTRAHYVCPMDPHNPVYVNGRPITGHRRLFEDDHILIGNTVLVFTERDFGKVEAVAGLEKVPRRPDQAADTSLMLDSKEEDEAGGWMVINDGGLLRYERWFGQLTRGLRPWAGLSMAVAS